MRTLFNAVLIAILSIGIIETPAFASPASSPSVPLGVVLQAANGKTADVNYGGATVYDGDRLQTAEDGSLRVRLGGPEMYLRSNSAAQVHAFPNGFSAELTAGSVVVSSAEGQTYQVLADGATIRPTGAQPTTGLITRVSANEVLLSSSRGSLEVTMGNEVETVEPGHSYKMEVEPDAAPADPAPQGGPYHTASNHFIWIVIAAVSVGTAIGVWRALVSPSHP